MVKSKKLSRGSLAVLLLALLLALSMVVGMTGAWFTDKSAGTDNDVLQFGTVALSADVTPNFVYTQANILKTVDGDSFSIDGGTVNNVSDVAVYYAYRYELDLYLSTDGGSTWTAVTDQTFPAHNNTNGEEIAAKGIKASFVGQSGAAFTADSLEVGYLATNTSTGGSWTKESGDTYAHITIADKSFVFNSDGAANGYANKIKVVVNIEIRLVQARNMTSAEVLAGALLVKQVLKVQQVTKLMKHLIAQNQQVNTLANVY